MRRAGGLIGTVLFAFLLTACFSGIGSPDGMLSLVVDKTLYQAGATLNLGDVDLEYGAVTLTAQLTSMSLRHLS